MPSNNDEQDELVVDLDDTLVRTDLLWESFFTLLGRSPIRALAALAQLVRGKAAFKQRVAQESPIEAEFLPYRETVLCEMRQARAQGKPLVLATAADESQARAVAHFLGVFDRILASDGITNLSSQNKCDAIVRSGSGQFQYIANAKADLPVWRRAKKAIVVNSSAGLVRALKRENLDYRILRDDAPQQLQAIVQAMRPQQWVKNLLVFVPIIMAQRWGDGPAVLTTLLTFFALSLAASGTYLLNDLMDIRSDRVHPRKRFRPLASGALSIKTGAFLSLALIGLGLIVAAMASVSASLGVAIYVVLTLTYSMFLKTQMLADVILLAGLYVFRIVLGGVVSHVLISHWLAVFSAFLFLSLALSKRTTELMEAKNRNYVNARRGYQLKDLHVLTLLGVTSGVCAVLVFCLYIADETVAGTYRSPVYLWAAAPALLYWIARVWMLAHRGELLDDPIVFAFRDKGSYVVASLIAAAFCLAMFARDLARSSYHVRLGSLRKLRGAIEILPS